MPDPLLVTKISLPILRNDLVSRKKILGQLNAGINDHHLLTLVSAPAGYGKTTAIRMWVEEEGHPVAWVTLDKSDNDLKQFFIYILTALGQAGGDLGQTVLKIVENAQQIDLQHVLNLLINDLYELDQPIVLVLEDYHLIENQRIDQAIELILNQAIANLHLVITTREDPNLPLTRLRVRNQLTEIRALDLSFSLDEADEFFSNVMGVDLSKKETEILKNKTEGWVAGLQLAGLSLKESADPTKFLEAFRGTHRHVLDYLIEEVLNSQPEDVREFLQRTSILDQLSPSLCDTVTGQETSRKYLHYLENNNLFLVSLDEERIWYRYHALFAELLKNQLLQAEPELVDVLQARAADWHQKNGFIQKAVEHAFQIPNSRKASELIAKHAIPMLYQGEAAIVMGWFDKIPEALIQDSPMMWISKAWAQALMQHQNRKEEIDRAILAANRALDLSNADEELRNLVAGHSASIQAYLMQSPSLTSEEAGKLIEISQKAQTLLPEAEKAIRSVNALNIGYGYLALADLPAAERSYKQALEYGIAGGNYYAAIYGPIDLIVIATLKGQLIDALELCETNINRFNRILAGQRFPPIGDLYCQKGNLLLEENRLVEAEQMLMQGLPLIRTMREYEAQIRGYSTLTRLRSIQGDLSGMYEGFKLFGKSRLEGALFANALYHRFSLRIPGADKTRFEDARLWVTQAALQFNALPDITSVDLTSRLRFQSYMSAAHILTRLMQRYPQAYSLLDIHKYLDRLEKFTNDHELVGWQIEIWILRALMHQVEGKAQEALHMIKLALSASAPQGYFRIFLDEADLMHTLLKSVEPRLKERELSAYVRRLLDAMPGETANVKIEAESEAILSDRELDVLRLLADGLSYKEIGEKLYLSLNTVQFHVKNIYGKLLVNKRTEAIEKAREIKLI